MELNHSHVLINGFISKPPKDVDSICDWMKRLIKKVKMKPLLAPQAEYVEGENGGITCVGVITTSHCSIHVWDTVEKPYFRFDLYSCKSFDLEDIMTMLDEFDVYELDIVEIDRNDSIRMVKNFAYYEEEYGN